MFSYSFYASKSTAAQNHEVVSFTRFTLGGSHYDFEQMCHNSTTSCNWINWSIFVPTNFEIKPAIVQPPVSWSKCLVVLDPPGQPLEPTSFALVLGIRSSAEAPPRRHGGQSARAAWGADIILGRRWNVCSRMEHEMGMNLEMLRTLGEFDFFAAWTWNKLEESGRIKSKNTKLCKLLSVGLD